MPALQLSLHGHSAMFISAAKDVSALLVEFKTTSMIRNIHNTVAKSVVGTDHRYMLTLTSAGLTWSRNVSSRRYKDDIKPMDNASEALYTLKPVTFRYKKEIDP